MKGGLIITIKQVKNTDTLSSLLRKKLGLQTDLCRNETFSKSAFSPISYIELEKIINALIEDVEVKSTFSNESSVIRCNFGELNETKKFNIYISEIKSELDKLFNLICALGYIICISSAISYHNTPLNEFKEFQKEIAECFSRSFCMTKDYFIRAIVRFSLNYGQVDIREIAKYFNVPERLVIQRGRDLRVWE